jgi:hypothetical protein
VIHIAYDDSGSMYNKGSSASPVATTRWNQGKYALEVFAAMLDDGDKMNVYLLNGPQKGTLSKMELVGSRNMAEPVRRIHEDMELGSGSTPFANVATAYQELIDATGANKWLIFVTDGDSFTSPNGGMWYVSDVVKQLESYAQRSPDIRIALLMIDYGGDKSGIRSDLANFTIYQADSSDPYSNIRSHLTALCNEIFQRNKLSGVDERNRVVQVDVPLSRLFVFAQGDGAAISGIKGMNVSPNTAQVRYSEDYAAALTALGGNRALFESTIDRSLTGQVAVFEADFAQDTPYEIQASGASILEVYYEPAVRAGMTFTRVNDPIVGNNGKVYAYREGDLPYQDIPEGEYLVELGLLDAQDRFTTSKLLGDISAAAQFKGNVEPVGQAAAPDGNVDPVIQTVRSGDTVKLLQGSFGGTVNVDYLDSYRQSMDIDGSGITIGPAPDVTDLVPAGAGGTAWGALPADWEGYVITRAGSGSGDVIVNGDVPMVHQGFVDGNGIYITANGPGGIDGITAASDNKYISFEYEFKDGKTSVTPRLTGAGDAYVIKEACGGAFTVKLTLGMSVFNVTQSVPVTATLDVPFIVEVPDEAPLVFAIEKGEFRVNPDDSVTPGDKRSDGAVLRATYNGEPLPEDVWRAMDEPEVSDRDGYGGYEYTVTKGTEPSTFVLESALADGYEYVDFFNELKVKTGARNLVVEAAAIIDGREQTTRDEAENPVKARYSFTGWRRWLQIIIAAILLALAGLVVFIISRIKVMPRKIAIETQPSDTYYTNSKGKPIASGIDAPDASKGGDTITIQPPEHIDYQHDASMTLNVKKKHSIFTPSANRRLELISVSTDAQPQGLTLRVSGTQFQYDAAQGLFVPKEDDRPFEIGNGDYFELHNRSVNYRPTLEFR